MLDMLSWMFIAAMTGCFIILFIWGIGISIYAVKELLYYYRHKDVMDALMCSCKDEETKKDIPMRIAYLCDGRACENCLDYCTHTFDIRHAKNFEVLDKTLALEKREFVEDVVVEEEE